MRSGRILRFHGIGIEGAVPAELKIADKWTGPKLYERSRTSFQAIIFAIGVPRAAYTCSSIAG